MSSCGNCDCADKSQCVKKGNNYGVVITETEKSYFAEVVETPASATGAEHDGKCKCGASCTCVDCTCGK
ncbi:Metallothionein domain-containing protein [Dioscorea alata]|uniref:Metallothionein domain-containing protein n=1 Tax=Dioscorea alata TaxID=55571 RepID=A0ACB7UBD3_DIOAL|nr:Metallothionein domain-containing protein [Dioscorea alata]